MILLPLAGSAPPERFCNTIFVNGAGALVIVPKRIFVDANAALSSGMVKSGFRDNADTVVDAVAVIVSNVVPPSVDLRNQPARYPPAAGVKVPPDVNQISNSGALLKLVCEKTPEVPPTDDVAAPPLANVLSSVVNKSTGV